MRKAQVSGPPFRAAQYVRMSVEHQRYSIDNQKAAIAAYAGEHGYEIVRSYADVGKSGLSLRGRAALRQLLADVLDPGRGYDAVLVLDVSRWGRFQNPDQAAHYEFICRQAKVRIIYCQEAFADDTSPTASMLKLLKRVMAAEFLRELSDKLSRAQRRLAGLGFKMGGSSPYGFRRLLKDEAGRSRMMLKPGDRKALQTDRVVLVPGPPGELAVVNRIFDMFANRGMSFAAIARRLDSEGILAGDGQWSASRVRTVLRSELCIGIYTYNRSTQRLQTRSKPNPEALWVRARIMEPVVPVALFERAQARLSASRPYRHSDESLLERLRTLQQQKGHLTEAIVQASPLTPNVSAYNYHFGSLQNAYKLIGYDQPEWVRRGFLKRPLTDDEICEGLRRMHARAGCITERAIDEDPELPRGQWVRRRFGSLAAALAAAGLPAASQSEKVLVTKYRNRARQRRKHLARGELGGESCPPATTPEAFIAGLTRLLGVHGYLSSALILADDALPTPSVLIRAFGSLLRAYELAGWQRSPHEIMAEAALRRYDRARREIADRAGHRREV